ncbi:tetratricopeptide repeat protein [Sphaerisporangium sp. NPDC005289]|uniref:ATP-binding protein n=1 Tax=Sphaerisporangium sp. NPDC005289 TaxID=3155247 RepID=UPI0033B1D2B7
MSGSVWLFYVVRAQGGQADWAAAFLAVAGLVTGLAQVLLGGLALRPAARTDTALAGGAAHRHLRGEGGDGTRPALTVPRQLPTAVAGFAGRTGELAALTSLLESTSTAATVVISAVDGTAGIGKTALAVCWAHGVADRFPDGQLYVNLRGFDPAGPPMSPADAVRGFLDAFEVPSERIPVGLDAQASLYRSILAGRRMLVLLDNARDAAQVRPLLPGTPGCFVLVTSRTRLTSLIAAEGARPLTVHLLPDAEARELLTCRLGPDRVAAEPQAVEEIITLCARLPLALSVVAARAAAHPQFSLAALARELRHTRGGLQGFEGGEVSVDVRVVFSWSYQRLDPAAARLFRLLGLHPGPDVTAAAAASLAGIDLAQARRAIADLAGYHLLAEQVPGRFGFHDLLRAYATELAGTHDSDDERQEARRRMLDHYLHTTYAANLLLHPRYDPITITASVPGVVAEEITEVASALAWFEAEYAVLLATIHLAVDAGHHNHAWQLPHELTEFFVRRGHWADWVAIEGTALGAVQCLGDRPGQAHTHRRLGRALAWLGRYDEAHDHLRQALVLFAELGDILGQADVYNRISAVFEQQGNPTDALTHAQRAVALARTTDSLRSLAQNLNNVGWYHALLGEPEPALSYCRQALTLNRQVGDRRGEASALDSLGYAYHRLGQYEQAIDYLQRACAITAELGDRHRLADQLDHLGDAFHAAGDHDAARAAWRQTLTILDQLGVVRAGTGPGYPDADEIGAKLRRLAEP